TDPLARALVHRQAGDVFAVQGDAPAIGFDQADHHVEARRLARAVGPSRPTTSPWRISKPKSCTTWRVRKLFCRPCADNMDQCDPAAAEAGTVGETEAGAVDVDADAGALTGADAGALVPAGLALAGAGLLRGCSVMCTRPPLAGVPCISPVSVL